MTPTTRTQTLEQMREEALNRIEAVTKTRGVPYQLCDPDDDEAIEDMPYVFIEVDAFYNKAHIFSIDLDPEDDSLFFDVFEFQTGHEEAVRPYKVSTEDICLIADIIDQLEHTGAFTEKESIIVKERDTYDPGSN